MRMLLPLLALLAATPAPAISQAPQADPACAAVRPAIPAAFAGWSDPTALTAGTRPGEGATMQVGRSVAASLHPARHLRLAASPGRAASADSNGGTLTVAVTEAGAYRVALGGRAWVDLLQEGKPVASATQGSGPKCSGIHKIVDYRLAPGNYTIQLAESEVDTMILMVAKS